MIVQLKMFDRSAYDRYQARCSTSSGKFSGRLLSADEHPAVLEGSWDRDKLVLMSFPDEAAFRAWSDSPEYQEISKDRQAGAQAVVLLARALDELETSEIIVDPARGAPARKTNSSLPERTESKAEGESNT